jgi:hypothetical protein
MHISLFMWYVSVRAWIIVMEIASFLQLTNMNKKSRRWFLDQVPSLEPPVGGTTQEAAPHFAHELYA